ncbi:MAG: hypothetical protein QXS85_01225 [Acidilobaceae archaeon]
MAEKCPPEKTILDQMYGIRVCAETGEVVEESVVSDDAEWRAYTAEEKARRARTGGVVSITEPNMGIGAVIGPVRPPGGRRVRGISRSPDAARVRRAFKRIRYVG